MRRHRGGRERNKEVREKGRRRIDEDNALESKMAQDRCLLLQPSKRLENCLSCKGGFLE